MAYQCGTIRFTGTIHGATYYKMNGEFHVRSKSSLTSKKFWKHSAFEGSRRSCKRFAQGNKLASKVYRSLPKERRLYSLFCQLKTAAVHYIKMGLDAEATIIRLQQHAQQEQFLLPNKIRKRKPHKSFPYALTITKDYIALPAGRLLQLLNTYTQDDLLSLAQKALRGHQISAPPCAIHLARA